MTDIPEADALEQRTPVQPGSESIEPSADPEVPEADAIEQSQVVGGDDLEDQR